MKRQSVIAAVLVVLTAVFTVVSALLLPNTVVTQFSAGGDVSTMPKLLAIALPFALGMGGAAGYFFSQAAAAEKSKFLVISAVGQVVFIITLLVNC